MDNGIYPVVTVKVSLKVKKGQEIAIDTASNTAEYCSDGTPGQLLYDPVLRSATLSPTARVSMTACCWCRPSSSTTSQAPAGSVAVRACCR